MLRKSWPFLAAILIVAAAAEASAQAPPREETAQQNVRDSEQYEQLLCTNPGFRKTRIDRECGPIGDPQLHQQCVDSFQCKSAPAVHPRRIPPSEQH